MNEMLQEMIDQFAADKKYIKQCRIVPRDIPLGQVHTISTTIDDDGTEINIIRSSHAPAPNGTFAFFSSRRDGCELFDVERFYLKSGEIVEIRWDTVSGSHDQEAALWAEQEASMEFYAAL